MAPEQGRELQHCLAQPGGLWVYPTESYYALGCRADDAVAVERVYQVKGRDHSQPLLVLVSDREMLARFCAWPLERFWPWVAPHWPGPLTILLPPQGLAAGLNSQGGLVGFRIPGNAAARELAQLAGCPLVGTSANKSGQLPQTSLAGVRAQLGLEVEWYLDGGVTPGGKPSTLVRLSQGRLELLRPGATEL